MAGKDYYATLGVPKGASPDDIKKAFRKLAHQHHPDKKGGNEAKFKELNEAYQVLSDPAKRQQYDQFGANFESAGGPGGFNWQDFSHARGGYGGANVNFDFGDLGDIFGDFFGGGRRRGGPQRGSDLQFATAVDFRESVFGAEKTLRFEKNVVCEHCSGSGAEPGSKVTTCATCGGQGQVSQVQRTILGAMRTVGTCPTCQGVGKTAEKVCGKCRGRGSEPGVRELKVKIPAGIADGQTMELAGEGEPGSHGGPPGSLLLTVQVRPDKIFKRRGNDLLTTKEISVALAALGGAVKLATLDGDINLKIPAGTQSGQAITLADKGVPILHGRGRGDLLVTIHVRTPHKLNKKQREALAALPKADGEELEEGGWL